VAAHHSRLNRVVGQRCPSNAQIKRRQVKQSKARQPEGTHKAKGSPAHYLTLTSAPDHAHTQLAIRQHLTPLNLAKPLALSSPIARLIIQKSNAD